MNTPYLYHLGNYHLGPIVFLRGNAKIVKQACSYKFYFYMQEEVTEFQLYGETCFCVSAAQKKNKKTVRFKTELLLFSMFPWQQMRFSTVDQTVLFKALNLFNSQEELIFE